MKKTLIILAEILIVNLSYSQDLVQDPGFDNNNACTSAFTCPPSCFGTCNSYWTAPHGIGDPEDPVTCPDGTTDHGIPTNSWDGAFGNQNLSSTPGNERYV